MNKETYKSLKIIIGQRGYHFFATETGKKHYKIVKAWINAIDHLK